MEKCNRQVEINRFLFPNVEEIESRLLRSLSSQTRLKIVRLLKDGIDHPEDLAEKVGVVRQAIDKHLLDMHALGLVERSAHFPPTGRPRVSYSLSPRGAKLYNEMGKLIKEFTDEMMRQYESMKKDVEEQLILGQIGEAGYEKKVSELKDRFSIILED